MRRLLPALLVAALVLTAAASAMRKPTAAESTQIRAAVKAFIAPDDPAAKDNKVVSIAVSSLDRRYASVRLNSPSAGPSDLVLHESMGTWWPEEFGSSLGCDTAPKAVLDDLHVGCTPPGAHAWIDNCGPIVAAPKALVLACADANYELAGLAWKGWGAATATATGQARANDCTPTCVAGHFHSYKVTVTAAKLTACGAARTYDLLTIAYAGARPAGIAKRDVHTLSC